MILQQKGLEFAKIFNVENKLKSAPVESLLKEHARLHTLLAKYDKEDIYNADETGLFFKMEPNQTLGTNSTSDHRKNKLNIKVVINYITDAWSNITQTTIQNCWIKTGILPSGNIKDVDDVNNNGDDINLDLSELERLL
ncbi:hypothetical protein RclHR1_34380001, partial [Rhizophagus clarus]